MLLVFAGASSEQDLTEGRGEETGKESSVDIADDYKAVQQEAPDDNFGTELNGIGTGSGDVGDDVEGQRNLDNLDGTEQAADDSAVDSVRDSVVESDRESLLDRVDLFDPDTKDEQELSEIAQNATNLDNNGNEASNEAVKVDSDFTESGATYSEEEVNKVSFENFVEAPFGLNDQFADADAEDLRKVDELFAPGTFDKADDVEGKVNSPSPETDEHRLTFQIKQDSYNVVLTESTVEDRRNQEKSEEELTETTEEPVPELAVCFPNVTGENEVTMPEKQEAEGQTSALEGPREDGGVLSPALQRANFRYRWSKTVRTDARDVVFFSTFKMVNNKTLLIKKKSNFPRNILANYC